MRSDMTYDDLKNQHDEIGAPAPCPSCFDLWQKGLITEKQHILTLHPIAVINPLSMFKGMRYICRRCGKMESLMSYLRMDESMSYPVVFQDWAEAIRLPPGLMWGASLFPTGGYDEWSETYDKLAGLPFYMFED